MNEPSAEPSVRSIEHAEARQKRITGSRIATIMDGTPAGWDTLSELLHSQDPEKFYQFENTPNMPEQLRRGQEYEGMARGEFFFDHSEFEVTEPTFLVPGPDFDDPYIQDWIGISPDCKLLPAGGVEFKVPSMERHLEWIEAGTVPREHLPQCALSMLVTGEDWYFRSFCPEIPNGDPKRTFEVLLKVEDTQVYLTMMREKLHLFLQGHMSYKVFSIDTTSKEIEESNPSFPVIDFGVNERAIAVLVDKYGKLEAPENSSEYAVIAAAHKDMVKRRTGADAAYKKATDAAKKYISGAMTEKKRLWGLMEATEKRLKAMRTVWEDEQERIKAEAAAQVKAEEEKEVTRVQEIHDAIDIINNMIKTLGGLDSGEIGLRIHKFQEIPVTKEIFMEFLPDAENAKTALIARAKEVFGTTVTVEAAERAAKEVARVAEIKDRISDISKWDAGLHAQVLGEIRSQLSRYKAYDVTFGVYGEFVDEAQQALVELIERTVKLLDEKEQQDVTRRENEELKSKLAAAEKAAAERPAMVIIDDPEKEDSPTAEKVAEVHEATEALVVGDSPEDPLMSDAVAHPVDVLVTCEYLVEFTAKEADGKIDIELVNAATKRVLDLEPLKMLKMRVSSTAMIHEPTTEQ